MEKFILAIQNDEQGHLYVPIEYSSKEELEEAIMNEIQNYLALDIDIHLVRFGKRDINMLKFIDWENIAYDLRKWQILSVDEWFEAYQ